MSESDLTHQDKSEGVYSKSRNTVVTSQTNSALSPHDIPITEQPKVTYQPIKPYWLFRNIVETKEIWYAFSNADSEKLEAAFQQDPESVVAVDGGRYDALLSERIKKPVYFEAKDVPIRRCTWFYRPDISQRFLPFPEEAGNLLEENYFNCVASGQWQKRISLPGLGGVVMENPNLLLYYKNGVDFWPSLPDSKASPRTIKRGLPENFEVMPSESSRVDHLVFIVQGIGSYCDLKMRTVSECVDGFRDIANELLSSHFKTERECEQIGRVEFLPVAWHAQLHTSGKGFDRCMRNITLPSIPKLRHFTNDTLLDILLYSSPTYCQSILNTVASDINRLYELFLKRNPDFTGTVCVAGHSLGSLILFDILANQKLENKSATSSDVLPDARNSSSFVDNDKSEASSRKNTQGPNTSFKSLLQSCHLEEYAALFEKSKIDLSSLTDMSIDDLKAIGVPIGPSKLLLDAVRSINHLEIAPTKDDRPHSPHNASTAGNSEVAHLESPSDPICLTFPVSSNPCLISLVYPRVQFEPACFFALGSPIAMFLAVRGYDAISENFKFPTCPSFFNIFHPYDPVAFRIEPLIDKKFSEKPVLIPHHKGRKRIHLEIRENLTKVGYEIKQKVFDTFKYTWDSLSGFAKVPTLPLPAGLDEDDKQEGKQSLEPECDIEAPAESSADEVLIGSLNGGKRIDYVLQEKPIEALNDYIFALTSHATYWDSEDTVLMILKEIYASQGVFVSCLAVEDKQLPQPETPISDIVPI